MSSFQEDNIWETIPKEITMEIFSHLEPRHLLVAAQVWLSWTPSHSKDLLIGFLSIRCVSYGESGVMMKACGNNSASDCTLFKRKTNFLLGNLFVLYTV